MKQIFLSFLALLFISSASAQFDHLDVLPDLEGAELFEAVVQDFKPASVLTYGEARDTLYGNIDVQNDSIECVYTGHKLYLDPTLDPTQALFLNGDPNGINTEHTYPQSKGAEKGFARSDMHHLYPTRVQTNSDRGSLPFGEIPDAQTDTWYLFTQEQSSIPGSNIDSYSEVTETLFEPRESHKGDVARSMMYFYTMYRDEALDADPEYFGIQKDILCQWHYEDVVDQKEWTRSQQIAFYQDGKANPFVLDCTLAARLYCGAISQECQLTNIDPEPVEIFSMYPNPAHDQISIVSSQSNSSYVIYGVLGQVLDSGEIITREKRIDISEWNQGIYTIQVFTDLNQKSQTLTFIKK